MHVITSYSHKLFLLNIKFAIQTYKVYFVLIREREKRQISILIYFNHKIKEL